MQAAACGGSRACASSCRSGVEWLRERARQGKLPRAASSMPKDSEVSDDDDDDTRLLAPRPPRTPKSQASTRPERTPAL